MGQATILPDLLEETPAPMGSADDLLAQLAGEEIDRLLAEADTLPEDGPSSGATPRSSTASHRIEVRPIDLNAPATQSTDDTLRTRTYLPASPSAPERVEAAAQFQPDHHLLLSEDKNLDTLPLYLKPLEWLNLPLKFCPESVRDALGKVAIITLFNAIAVLVYVTLIRKH